MKKEMTILLVLLMAVGFAASVSAFGIVTPYWTTNPMAMNPGESKDIVLTLQNGAGATEDVTAKVTLIQGSEIASITDYSSQYLVEPNGETNVHVHVAIPMNAAVGTKYTLGFSIVASAAAATGGVGMAPAMDKYFTVVVEAPKEVERPGMSNSQIVVLVAVLLIVLWILFRLLNKEKKRK